MNDYSYLQRLKTKTLNQSLQITIDNVLFLLFLPSTFSILNLEETLVPVQEPLDDILISEILFSILAAILIGVVGVGFSLKWCNAFSRIFYQLQKSIK